MLQILPNLRRVSKIVPTGYREAPGRSPGTPRDLPGTIECLVDVCSIFQVGFEMNSDSDVYSFAKLFVELFVSACDSD